MQSMLKACQAANKGQLLQASSRAVALGNVAETTVAEPVAAVAAVPKGLCGYHSQRIVLPSHCGNLAIFLPLRFYVKPNLAILKLQK